MPDALPQKRFTTPISTNENERLAALHRYKILDTPPEAAFDRITTLAARLFQVPIALISLVDESRAWFKSCIGFGAREVSRDDTLCSFAVLTDEPLIIPDARKDDRFACNPFVQQESGVRFYAGAPLLSQDGFNLGTLCLLDTQPRDPLTPEQQATLVDLAAMVVDELELRLAACKIAQVDAALLKITRGVASATGGAFFEAMVQHFASILDVEYVYIGLVEGDDLRRLRTIATCVQGQIVENLEYPLQETPCWEVLQQGRICCYPRDVQAHFPRAPRLKPQSVESYVAAPFLDSNGKPLGLLGVMDSKPLENVHLAESLLMLFADRIATELERQQAEQERERFLAVAADLQMVIGFDHNLKWVSPTFEQSLGWTATEMIGQPWFNLAHPDDIDGFNQRGDEGISDNETFAFENRYQHKDGSYRWFLWNVRPYSEERLIYVTAVDISDRKQTEELLRHSADRDAFRVTLADALRPLADPVEIQATTSRMLGGYLGANRVAYFEIRGADYVVERDYVNGAEALAGGYPIDSFGPKLLAAYRTGRSVSASNVETDPNLSPEQRSAYAAIQIRAYIGIPLVKDGEFVAGLAVHSSKPRDWTLDEVALVEEVADRIWASVDRARAESALRESERFLKGINETAPNLLYIFDLNERRNVYISPQIFPMLGVLPADVQVLDSQVLAELFHPDDLERIEQHHDRIRVAQEDDIFTLEYRMKHSSGKWLWLSSRDTIFVRDAQGKPTQILGSAIDITDLKQAEAEREQLLAREQAAREQAEQANRIKDEFLAVLSHELRSPLNPILGWAKLLKSGNLDAAKTAQALTTIERNAKLQSELIEDLLDVSRILQGKLSLNVSPIQLTSTIRGAIETVQLAAEAKSITVEANLDAETGQVTGDATRLQQVVWNLLSNAVKFTPTGGRVEVRLEQVDDQAQITVSDNGKGIPANFLPHVFDYFRQEDGATTRKFGGLGLGLAIVRHLVELHGGTVEVESAGEGLGAMFTIKLPLMPIQTPIDLDQLADELSFNLIGVQALVIDDEPDSREFVAFVLEQAGAIVTTAATAAEGFLALTQSPPDVLLSDIGMPDMDGYMLMRQVRALPSEQGGQVKAIALTAYAGDFNQQQALQAGFQRHLSKPIEPNELITNIVDLIRRKSLD
ncbi:MAG: PAS domain-containing protein [Plectolyngbya sp. WJT66-NPBG17]|jgi:PAS domain S-box-containing protein|nr:PAS domain-containing protein [Plectolyngbya sp. WJT66-NPBG17]